MGHPATFSGDTYKCNEASIVNESLFIEVWFFTK